MHWLIFWPAPFRSLYTDGQATVQKLAEKLTLELVNHIEVNALSRPFSSVGGALWLQVLSLCVLCALQRSLPRLEQQVEEKLTQTQVELERYGTGPPPEAAERLLYLIDVSGWGARNTCRYVKWISKWNDEPPFLSSLVPESDSFCPRRHQFDDRGRAQVWRQSQHLFHTQKTVQVVENAPGRLRRKM